MPAALIGILLSALRTMLGFVLRSVIVKFVTYFALFFIVTEFTQVVVAFHLIPGADNANQLSGSMSNIPSSVWYFLDLFAASSGIQLIVSAYATRFIIRRIPVIG